MAFQPAFAVFIVLLFLFILYVLVRPVVRGAIFFPTNRQDIAIMKKFAGIKPGERLIDLGSGDGRIIMAFAHDGVEAHGYEINPLLVLFSRLSIRKAGLGGKAFVHWKSFWHVDLEPFDIVVVYGFPRIMSQLEEKIKRELKLDARVISNIYKFSGLKPISNENRIYLYSR